MHAYAGRPALAAVIATAHEAGVVDVLVVTGYHRALVAPVVHACGARECHNPKPERGMMSSVRAGVAALPSGAAALIWPVDHPLVRAATIRQVVAAWASGPDPTARPIVIPCYAGRGGHPTLFPADLRPAILALDDAGGLNRLARRHADRVLRLEVEDPGIIQDLDSPAAMPEAAT